MINRIRLAKPPSPQDCSTRRTSGRTVDQEREAGLLCVVQYPPGQVFVSAPNRPGGVSGGHEMKRTKNIQKKSLPSPRKEDQ